MMNQRIKEKSSLNNYSQMALSPVDEIKNRLDILEVIGSYIKLQKAGRNYKALCPFHSEKTPSFMVSPERQIWHCFGCQQGGDIFAFIKQIEGVEFGDALRILAQRAGIVLKRQDPAIQTQRKRLYEICELAAKFFQKQLESKTGQKAYQYLVKERRLKPETIKTWRLGWAPDEWHSLSNFLTQRGYPEEEIFNTGLTVKKDENNNSPRPPLNLRGGEGELNRYHDRFRSRIIFPLFDIQGQVVGFAGRIFGKEDADVGKYINTPQTLLYDKSQILFGLNFAKQDLRQKNSCILVEGNLDVIMSHQVGVKNVVASSGTALTPEHLKIIRRYTDNLIFAFDMDLAGENATKRSIDLALENDFNIKVINILPDKTQGKIKDPAELIKQDPAQWFKVIAQTISIMDYYFTSTFAKFSEPVKDVDDKRQIAKILLPVIKRIANQIEQMHWLGGLAKRLKVDEKILYTEMQKIKTLNYPTATQSQDIEPASKQTTRIQDLEERLLSLYLNYPQYLEKFWEHPKNIFSSQQLVEILEHLKENAKNVTEKEICLQRLRKKISGGLVSTLDYLSIKIEQFPIEEATVTQEIQGCIKELKIIKIKEKMNELSFEIQEIQEQNDKQKLAKTLEKFKNLSNQLIELMQ